MGDRNVTALTQTSLAVSAGGIGWTLIDASPDLRTQIGASPVLRPSAREAVRSSPIKAVVVTGFEIDQVGGLLNLREGQAFQLHATPFVLGSLQSNPIFGVLTRSCVTRHIMEPGQPFEPFEGSGIEIQPVAIRGKIPFHVAERKLQGGETVGLIIRNVGTGKRLAYVPSCAGVTPGLLREIDGVDVLLFDGTLFTDDELIGQGLSNKTGADMGHISMRGPAGAIDKLRSATVPRRIFIHLNNSNPVLRSDSRERAVVADAGWEVAFDGMEITL